MSNQTKQINSDRLDFRAPEFSDDNYGYGPRWSFADEPVLEHEYCKPFMDYDDAGYHSDLTANA